MSTPTFSKYGLRWKKGTSPLYIELYCIRKKIGNLDEHYQEATRLCWPNLDNHRWAKLCRDEMAKNKVTVLMGPGSSGKTFSAAGFGLLFYWADPKNTCVLISSTDVRGLRLRIWGEITKLWQEARVLHPWLAGNLIDSRIAITTDSISEDADENTIRDMRNGIIGIPTIQGGKQVGLGKWAGIKNENVLLIADEAQFMGPSFLSAFANLNKNEEFKAIVLGNPVDLLDPLGKAAEPREGWSSYMNPEKTVVWETRFMGGRCVNLVGTDSPNFDYPQDQPAKYKYLISGEKIKQTEAFFSKDSLEYYSQCVGTMRVGIMSRRVLSRELCEQFNATSDLIWAGEETTKIAALDAAYGGDRCVLGHLEIGKCADGKTRIKFSSPTIVPIKISSSGPLLDAEQQIAAYCKAYCEGEGIAPENFFHDSTGRGSLGTALAREWSSACHPVEFGGAPSKRPVTADLFVPDLATGARRLKRCDEHYVKFVTELWFAVRYAVEADQIRMLPEEAMDEFCMREWKRSKGDKIEIETKTEMKLRSGKSPDFADWASICVEGARRKGFVITKLGNIIDDAQSYKWLVDLAQKRDKWHESKRLKFS